MEVGQRLELSEQIWKNILLGYSFFSFSLSVAGAGQLMPKTLAILAATAIASSLFVFLKNKQRSRQVVFLLLVLLADNLSNSLAIHAYLRNAQKVEAYATWLEQHQREEVLVVTRSIEEGLHKLEKEAYQFRKDAEKHRLLAIEQAHRIRCGSKCKTHKEKADFLEKRAKEIDAKKSSLERYQLESEQCIRFAESPRIRRCLRMLVRDLPSSLIDRQAIEKKLTKHEALVILPPSNHFELLLACPRSSWDSGDVPPFFFALLLFTFFPLSLASFLHGHRVRNSVLLMRKNLIQWELFGHEEEVIHALELLSHAFQRIAHAKKPILAIAQAPGEPLLSILAALQAFGVIKAINEKSDDLTFHVSLKADEFTFLVHALVAEKNAWLMRSHQN